MPTHDWTRVKSGIFHHFHQQWISTISDTLNDGLLPEPFYALAEQIAEGPRPDVITLEAEDESWQALNGGVENGAVEVAEHPPRVRYTEEMERDIYAKAANRVAVYHSSGDRVVAYIEIISPGNKQSQFEVERFIEKVDEAILRGCHLLLIDVHPPGRHDPRGMHAAIWEHRTGEAHGVTEDEPLGLSAYAITRVELSTVVPKAYFQPVAVGQPLPEMPLFLTSAHYINVPLEETYMEAWQGVPNRWKRVIEAEET